MKISLSSAFYFITFIIGGGAVALLTGCAPKGLKEIQVRADSFQKKYPNQSVTFEVGNRPIHYVYAGDKTKPVIVFVHGSPGGWSGWIDYLNDPVLQSKFFMISIDRWGYGGSSPGKSVVSLDDQAGLINEVLKKESVTQAHLVGHSYGGPVVAKFAILYPQMTRSLLILAGSLSPDEELTKWYQYAADSIFFNWAVPTDLSVCNQEIMGLKKELLSMKPELAKIKAPTTVIQGTADDLVPPSNADYIVKYFTGTHVKDIRLENMNHFIPWDRAEVVKKNLLEINP